MNADQAWNSLKGRMNEEVEEYVPKKRRRNQNRPGWLTQDIVREIRKKKRLWRKAKAGEGVEEKILQLRQGQDQGEDRHWPSEGQLWQSVQRRH